MLHAMSSTFYMLLMSKRSYLMGFHVLVSIHASGCDLAATPPTPKRLKDLILSRPLDGAGSHHAEIFTGGSPAAGGLNAPEWKYQC